MRDQTSYSVLCVTGVDRQGLLSELAQMALDTRVNIEECVAHAYGDHAIIFLFLAGNELDLKAMKLSADQQYNEHGVVMEIVEAPGIPATHQPIPWRLEITARDYIGLLAVVTGLLGEGNIMILSHRGEQYQPPRSAGVRACVLHFLIRVPVNFDRTSLEDELRRMQQEQKLTNWMLDAL